MYNFKFIFQNKKKTGLSEIQTGRVAFFKLIPYFFYCTGAGAGAGCCGR